MTAPLSPAQRTALEAFMAPAAGASGVHVTDARLLSGGAIQQNWALDVAVEGGPLAGAQALVLRSDAPSGVSTSHGRAQEFALLRAAFGAGVTVPEPLWLCEDRAVLGRPFFVMRRAAGTAAAHRLVREAGLGGDRVRLAERLGRELARIHSIRPPRADLPFLPLPEPTPALALVRRARAALDALDMPHPVLEWGLRWLERHAPPAPESLVLCHRDFRTGNYLVDEQGLTAVLDWEFAGWGDPLEDLGWLCAKCWRFGRDDREAGGVGAREDLYRGYEAESGRALDRAQVRYWEVMAHANWALISIQQAQRHVSGEERSLLLALTGHITPELEWEILAMTEAD